MSQARARTDNPEPVAGVVDPVWTRIREEAETAIRQEPSLGGLVLTSLLNHETLEAAVVHRVASRLGHASVPSDLIEQTFLEALQAEPAIGDAFRADIAALWTATGGDPVIEPVLYFKGFHAIQTHRLAHWLWNRGRYDFALYLQSRSSEVFQTDINPAARIGRGIFLDHATGLVVVRRPSSRTTSRCCRM
jgi:serine O-acetyltransferase